MTRFFKNIIWFFLPLLLVSVLLDWYISDQLKKSDYYAHGETYIWNKIVEGEIEDDIYIYGSSRAWVHINPFILQDSLGMSAYNFGIDGHNFWLQNLRHELLLKNNPKPKVIILSVDMFSLIDLKSNYNLQQFYPFICNTDIRKYIYKYEGLDWFDFYFPLIRYQKDKTEIKKELFSKSSNGQSSFFRKKGFREVGRTWNADLDKAKEKMEYYEVVKFPPHEKLLYRFLDECKELNIKVILVYTPEHIFGQEFVKNREEIINTYQRMADEKKLLFLDYSNDSLCFRKELFYNSQHLNEQGARLFSQKLAHDLKLILANNEKN